MKEKIDLYKFKGSTINSTFSVFFNDQDNLIFEGFDFGSSVENYIGRDLEYWYILNAKNVQKLNKSFSFENFDKQRLLEEIRKRFNGVDAESNLKSFLKKNNIMYKFSRW